MALNWDGLLTTLSNPDDLERRANRVIAFGGLVLLGLVILFKVWR